MPPVYTLEYTTWYLFVEIESYNFFAQANIKL
jgi:hypothetical protein